MEKQRERMLSYANHMASDVKIVTVLVSSSGDMDGERRIVDGSLEAMNSELLASHGILLKFLDWHRDIVPGVSSSVQEVINEQSISKADIYLGLLGTRFGTPTSKAGSGTEEDSISLSINSGVTVLQLGSSSALKLRQITFSMLYRSTKSSERLQKFSFRYRSFVLYFLEFR